MILSQAIIADIVPAKDRGKYMGPMGALFGISAVIGPLLGGLFTQHADWRWCFWINIPIGIAAFAIAWFTLKLPTHRSGKKIDVAGIFFMVVATSGLVLATSWAVLDRQRRLRLVRPGPARPRRSARVVVDRRRSSWSSSAPRSRSCRCACSGTRRSPSPPLIGLILGMGMFAALAFLPTFLQMSTGAGRHRVRLPACCR